MWLTSLIFGPALEQKPADPAPAEEPKAALQLAMEADREFRVIERYSQAIIDPREIYGAVAAGIGGGGTRHGIYATGGATSGVALFGPIRAVGGITSSDPAPPPPEPEKPPTDWVADRFSGIEF